MLYIISKNWNQIPGYLFQGLDGAKDIEVIGFEKYGKNKLRKFLRAYVIHRRGLWLRHFYSEPFLRSVREIGPDDAVLFFAVKNMKDLRILCHDIKAARKSVYLWDPVSWIRRGWYRKLQFRIFMRIKGTEVCTFDPTDARNFHFKAISQVYRWPEQPASATTTTDVFFVGQDKQRGPELARLITMLKEAGAKLDCNIIRDKKSAKRAELSDYYITSLMPYEDTLRHIAHARCLLEITQRGQDGLTLRTMEALFFEKKLITNNPHVQKCDFYHPNNMLVYDDSTTPADIQTFLEKPVWPVPKELIEKYNIRHWIEQFQCTQQKHQPSNHL